MPDGVETEAAAELFEEIVVRVRECFGHVHVTAAADFNRRVRSDNSLFQRGDGDDGLGRRTWLESGGVRKLLIDDREDAPGRRIDGDYRAVLAPNCIQGSLTNDGIVETRIVPDGRVSHVRGHAAIIVAIAMPR